MLPSDLSLERQVWVERFKNIRHAWAGDSKTTKLLQNMLILLAINQNEANIKFWQKILIDIGARVQLYNDKSWYPRNSHNMYTSVLQCFVLIVEGVCLFY